MIFPNLRAEMARKNVTNSALAKTICCDSSTMSGKLNKIGRLKFAEAKKIRDVWFSDLDMDYLFAQDNN